MAGHSKFKNIMHRKGAQDKKRAQLFSRLSKEIMVAAKLGDPDPEANPRLRLAVQAAKAQSMPKDNIERAIQKGAGGGEGTNYDEVRYEGYGPGGVAIIVDVMTDNRNRSAADIRAIFNKNGGNMGESGSVAFMFERAGEVRYGLDVADNEAMFEAALEAGAEDVETDDDGHVVTCQADDLGDVSYALQDRFGPAEQARLIWKPQRLTPIEGEAAETLMKLLNALDDYDDTQNVWANYDIPDAELERLAG